MYLSAVIGPICIKRLYGFRGTAPQLLGSAKSIILFIQGHDILEGGLREWRFISTPRHLSCIVIIIIGLQFVLPTFN